MAETIYPFGPGSYAPSQLAGEITAAGLPAPLDVRGSGYTGPGTPATDIEVVYAAPLGPGQVNTLNATVAAHVPASPKRSRLIFDVVADVDALTVAQKSAIFSDLNAGTPPKWATDRGLSAPDLHIVWMLAQKLGCVQTQADKNFCRTMLIAIYVTDEPNWNYLVHPAFAPEVNIPGSEPVP